MKKIISIVMGLIFVGLPTTNAHAEEVVNEILSEKASITGVYYDPAPLPDFPGGLFRFIATVKNITNTEQVASLAFRVRQLTNGNTLFNGDNGRYGRLTSQITAGGVFEWKPGEVLPAQYVVEAPALIQSNLPPEGNGNFEVVYRDSNDQLLHLFRRNDVEGFPWIEGNDGESFGDDVKSAPALIQSNLPQGGPGNFEVVYRDSNDKLLHWFRRNDVDGFPWVEGNDGEPFGYDVKSAPALIQSNLPQGGRGNFEVVYRDSNDQLRHWFRRNDADGFPWVEGNGGKAFAYDVKSTPALIQNRRNGNLEVVYRDGNDQLRHWFRDSNSVWRPGNNGVPFGDDVTSAPALIQSNLGSQGDNFEVVVRKSDNTLHHYFRQRNPEDQNVFEWKSGGEPFADNVNSAPALIQSNLGAAGGNFEVVVQEEGDLHHYFRTKKGEVILKPEQEVSTQFVIGIVDKNPGQFLLYVDAVGIRVPIPSTIVYLDDEDASFNQEVPDNNGFNNKVDEITGTNHGNVTFIIKKGLYRKQSVILDPSNTQEIAGRTISFIGEDGAIMSGAEELTEWPEEPYDPVNNCWSIPYTPEMPSLVHPNDLYNCQPFCTGISCKVREDLYLNNAIMEQVEHDKTLEVGQWKFNIVRDNRFSPDLTCDSEELEQDTTKIPTKIYACFKRDDVANEFDIENQLIEISRARVAFGGSDTSEDRLETSRSISGVTIKNVIVEKYASPIQFGTIGYQKVGDHWTIKNNEARWNHSAGIAFDNDALVIGNYAHDNGQIGIKTGLTESPPLRGKYDYLWDTTNSGRGAEVTQNVIEQNGRPDLGYKDDNEAGGTKFSKTRGLLVERNWVKDNGAPGLWGDINNCDMRYYCNVVEDNRSEGIVHELSYLADIAGNVVRENGSNIPRLVSPENEPEEPVWLSQIFIRTSSKTKVNDNYVEADDEVGNGITILEEKGRNDEAADYCDPDADPARLARYNTIIGNTIIQKDLKSTGELTDDEYATAQEKEDARTVLNVWYLDGLNGINGASQKKNQGFDASFWATNSYQDNKYYLERPGSGTVEDPGGTYWNWTTANNQPEGQRMDFVTFQDQAAPEPEKTQERNSTKPQQLGVAPLPPLECKYGNSVTEDQSLKEKSVCLVALNNENYLVNEQFGYPVSAKGTACDQDAQLMFEDKNGGHLVDGDIVFIRTANDGYWSANSDGVLSVSSSPSATDSDLRFQVHKVSEGGAIISDYDQLALKTSHDKWVVAEDGGGGVVRANRPVADKWETFTYILGN